MIRLILASACSWAAWNAALPLPEAAPKHLAVAAPEDKALKALDAWLKHYRAGKIQIRAPGQWKFLLVDNKDAIAPRFDIVPKGFGNTTWMDDLDDILTQVAKLAPADSVPALLEVAAVGLDQGTYTREMAPIEVRAKGEEWIKKLTGDAVPEQLVRAARGELKIEKARARPVQAAAARCLGATRNPAHRTVIEPLLGSSEIVVRIHAAEALGMLGDEAASLALIAAIEREESDLVLPSIVQALRNLYAKYLPKSGGEVRPKDVPADGKPKAGEEPAGAPTVKPAEPAAESPAAAPAAPATLPESTRLAVRAAIKSLGRTNWRGDMVLLKLLDDFRTLEAIPALIGQLERFRDHPEEVQSGKLSGLLLHRSHELLVSMTGAVIPATQPEKWRELWERDKDKIEVAKKREPEGENGTAAGFCGIPVQGSRVIFILDLSRSMTFKMNKSAGTTSTGKRAAEPEGASTRLDFAQRELNRAMDLISPAASFNLITFDGDAEAKAWPKKGMVPANEKNRDAFRKHVAKLVANGGTNLWSALELALKTKSLVYGDRYETNCDEMFILSDGAPSVGEVLDPTEILRLVKESNRFAGMRINTIFISSQNPEERQQNMPWMNMTPEELMKRMAEENGGKFVNL